MRVVRMIRANKLRVNRRPRLRSMMMMRDSEFGGGVVSTGESAPSADTGCEEEGTLGGAHFSSASSIKEDTGATADINGRISIPKEKIPNHMKMLMPGKELKM